MELLNRSGASRSLKWRACLNFILAALFLIALAPQMARATEAALAAKTADVSRLDAAIAEQGAVRVLVELSGIAHPAGEASESALEQHGSRLAAAQDALLHDLSAGNTKAVEAWHVRKLSLSPLVAMTVNRADLVRLAAHPGVARIAEDSRNFVSLTQSVPLIGMTNAYAGGATGANAIVAIVDTGVDKTHDFFSGGSRVIAEACFGSNTTYSNATVTSNCPGGVTSSTATGSAVPTACVGVSGCDHGTHVAGIAAGNAPARSPTNGVAKSADIFAVNVFSKMTYNGTGTNPCGGATSCITAFDSDIIAALNNIYARRASFPGKVIAAINMSLGNGVLNTGYCDTSSYKTPIDSLRAAGIATVIAAGNEYFTTGVAGPACVSTAVTVGSTTKADLVSGFSNVGPQVDVFAPGQSITASVFSNAMGSKSGTSMATPHVVGAFAALRSAVPSATVDQIENALKTTGLNITDSTPRADGSSGSGLTKPRIRVDLALNQLLGTGGPVLSLTPSSGFTSTGAAGGPFTPSSQVYTVSNSGTGTMSWSAASSDTTVATVSPTSGTLGAGASINVTVSIAAAANSKSAGSYSSTISFTNSTNALGNTSVVASLSVTAPPATNDNFANALVLTGSAGSITPVSNASATLESGEPNHAGVSLPLNSLWYKWTAPASGVVVFNTAGSSFDTTLGAYKGTSVASLSLIANNDDNPGTGSLQARIAFAAVAGQTYYVAVDGYGSATGTVALSWSQTLTTATPILSAVLPYARSTNPGRGALTLGQIINNGTVAAQDCVLGLPNGFPGTLAHQRMNSDGSLAGRQFDPATIAAGAAQGWVFQYTPSATFPATDIPIIFDCANTAPAQVITGVNTFLVSVSPTLPPDLLMYTVTTSVPDDKILRLPGNTGTNIVGMISQNVGSAGNITVSVDDNGRGLPLTALICRVTPSQTCYNPPSPTVTVGMAANAVETFTVFVTGSGAIAPDAANNRIYIRMKDSTGETRGATALAVYTLATGGAEVSAAIPADAPAAR